MSAALSLFFLFIQPQIPAHGMVPSKFSMNLPSSVNLKHPRVYLLGDSKTSSGRQWEDKPLSHLLIEVDERRDIFILVGGLACRTTGHSVCHSEAEARSVYMASLTRTLQVKGEGDWVAPGFFRNAKFICISSFSPILSYPR